MRSDFHKFNCSSLSYNLNAVILTKMSVIRLFAIAHLKVCIEFKIRNRCTKRRFFAYLYFVCFHVSASENSLNFLPTQTTHSYNRMCLQSSVL